ncbi:hypothetical protein AVEN_32837-1 [Araneus ventricosus]|uniref:Uncharacterized protein n=1 Tax=Araneus ventricosus TaxID=182803 RepID=A0A4Y2DY86_ARAVE|nr:hypothetical protein AVEN_32837-1 [Araneus ventricosus]
MICCATSHLYYNAPSHVWATESCQCSCRLGKRAATGGVTYRRRLIGSIAHNDKRLAQATNGATGCLWLVAAIRHERSVCKVCKKTSRRENTSLKNGNKIQIK